MTAHRVLPDDQISCERIETGQPGNRLRGLLYRPVDANRSRPAVIFSHGFGSSIDATAPTARRFARFGFIAAAFDFRGGSTVSISDGDMLHMSLVTHCADLDDAVKCLSKDPQVDPDRICLAGVSQGGCASALYACDHPDQVSAMALWAPAFCIPEPSRRYTAVDQIPSTMTIMGNRVGRQYYADILGLDVFDRLGRYSRPVLIVHGIEDTVVPARDSVRAARLFGDARLDLIPGQHHTFTKGFIPSAVARSARFLIDHIGSGIES